MRKIAKNGFSGIEVLFTMVITTVLMFVSVDSYTQVQDNTNKITTKTIVEQEADNALIFISNKGINEEQMYVNTSYVSEFESKIEIKTITCETGSVGTTAHRITIVEKDSTVSKSFTTCENINEYVFTETQL